MRQHLRSEPDPSNPLLSPAEVLRAQPDEVGSEIDLVELAARFSAHGGGSLSPELSTDLALEVVLNEIVEQACLATGATGAAIVLRRGEEMVCRASSGETAPDLGSRLDPASGISGQCIRTFLTKRCNDVLTDPHADLEASYRLGIRSVLVMPLLRGDNLLGVFELFSSRPFAFGERDERTLEALVTRTLANLNRASEPLVMAVETAPPASDNAFATQTAELRAVSEEYMTRDAATLPRSGSDFLTLMLGAAVLVCAVTLGVLVGRHFGFQRMVERARPTPASSSLSNTPAAPTISNAAVTGSLPDAANARDKQLVVETIQPGVLSKSAQDAAAPGGLQVYENGKEIFRLPPGKPQSRPSHTSVPRPRQTQPEPTDAGPASSANVAAAQTPAEESTAIQPPPIQHAAAIERAAIVPENVVELSPADAEQSLLNRVEPEYPEAARQQNIQGEVTLEVRIGTDGTVEGVEILSGPRQLAQASADAVKQWRFKPRMRDGQAVRMQTRVALSFRLPG
jgi:TonB family protein